MTRPYEGPSTMFMNALAGAIDAAHPKQFDYLSRQLWQAHAAGHIHRPAPPGPYEEPLCLEIRAAVSDTHEFRLASSLRSMLGISRQ
jgi:hypothetical protein